MSTYSPSCAVSILSRETSNIAKIVSDDEIFACKNMKLIVLNENCELTKRISELCKHKPFKLLLLPALLYIL